MLIAGLVVILTGIAAADDELPLVAAGKIVPIAWTDAVNAGKAPAVLLAELQRRAPNAKSAGGEPVVHFDTTDSFDVGPEGFELYIHDGKLDVVGRDDLGLLYAVGEILRRSDTAGEDFTLKLELNPWLSRPICPMRGVWLDVAAEDRYGPWEPADLRELLLDLTLWGMNTLAVPVRADWGPPPEDAEDDSSPEWTKTLRAMALAHELGVKVCVVTSANSAAPERLRRQPVLKATPSPTSHGAQAPLACPTMTQGRLAILKAKTDLLQRLPQVDCLLLTPFDDGGCWCDKCRERGWAEAYLDMAKRIGQVAKQHHPGVELILTDSHFWQEGQRETQWAKLLADAARDDADWIDYFAAARPTERTHTELRLHRLSLLDASPLATSRFGAVPTLVASPSAWREQLDAAPNYRGFLMRTTGVHDHLNVMAALRWNWSPRRTPHNLATFLTRYFFGSEACERLVPVVLGMDHGIPGAGNEATPFERGNQKTADLLAAALDRRNTLRQVAESLRADARESALFQSLLKRATVEVEYWEGAK